MTRLTRWPPEPPLQIWRCPMGSGAGAAALAGAGGMTPTPGEGSTAADVISSIRVHHVRYSQRTTSGGGTSDECQRSDHVKAGAYDEAGGFAWQDVPAAAVPAGPGLSSFDPPDNCRPYRYRGVSISWTDALGEQGFEEVRY